MQHHTILWVPIDQSIIISLQLILLELNENMTTFNFDYIFFW